MKSIYTKSVTQKLDLHKTFLSFLYEKSTPQGALGLTGNALSSQSVSRQVLSAYECLTTVFGMGTGGTTQLSSLDILLNVMHIQNYTEEIFMSNILALER